MLCALSFAGAALVPGSSRPAVSTRSVSRRDMAGLAAVAFAGVAMPAFADEAADKKAADKQAKKDQDAADKKAAKGPPPNLGGPMASTQKTALGIVSDSKMPQFRDSKGLPIPPFKVAPLGKLDPKVRHALTPELLHPFAPSFTRAPSPWFPPSSRNYTRSFTTSLSLSCLTPSPPPLQITRPMFNK